MSELPKGWAEGTIEDVLGVLPSGKQLDQGWSPRCENFPSASEETWGALKTTAIQDGWFEPEHTKQLPAHLDPKPELEVKPGDVLLTCAGPRVRCGVICRVNDVRKKLFISGKMYRFRPDEQLINPDFLMGLLRSPEQKVAIDQIKTGGSESGLNLTQARFKGLKVKIPPLREQQRIVKKLDALSKRNNIARSQIGAIEKLVKRYRAAVLFSAFSGRLTEDWRAQKGYRESPKEYLDDLLTLRREKWIESEVKKRPDGDRGKTSKRYKEPNLNVPADLPGLPHGWQWVPTEALATKVVDGVHKKPSYVNEGVPFIMVKDLTAGPGISFEETKFITTADHEEYTRRTDPELGDILITKDGTLGVVRRVDTDREFSIFVSLALVKPADRKLSRYLEYAYQSPQLQEQMVGVGSGLQHIHLTDLRKDCVPLAPRDEQNEIVRRIEAAFAKIDRLAAEAGRALTLTGRLEQRILTKAFSGELVPQDPTDEPVSALLDRTRAERGSAPKPKRGRRKKVDA